VSWFEDRVENEDVSLENKAFSRGPDYRVRIFNGYLINPYRFHTVAHDANLIMQRSGVTLKL